MLKPLRAQPQGLDFTTIRDFGGGLNIVDNDLNLDSRYSTLLENMYRGQDGTMAVRFGTTHFVDLIDLDIDDIVAIFYYNATIVAINRDGVVASVDGTGMANIIFDNTIASSLPGAPLGWDETSYVDGKQFNGTLILANGVNKPLVVYSDNTCEYMVDGSTGSNLYVPVARNITVHNEYICLSGDPFNPSILFIGSRGVLGVFEGAPAPNDGVNIDLGPFVRTGSNIIRGHVSFRDKLIVFFDEQILIGTLGIYTSTAHTPDFSDAIEQVGAVNGRTAIAIGDDVFFANFDTVSSLTRALFTGDVKPESASALIDPLVSYYMSRLDDVALRDNVFAVFNPFDNQYMLFIPNDSSPENASETICPVFTIARQSKDRPWAVFRGWNWSCGCTSAGGRVFFAKGSNVFYYGSINDRFYGDYIGYEDTWDDETIFDDGHGWEVPANLADDYDETTTGVTIDFDWVLPWADFEKRLVNKFTKYVALDTNGAATYTLNMFVDNFVLDRSSLGEMFTDETLFDDSTGFTPQATLPYIPALTMQFTSADESGYGAGGYGASPYGGGRPTPYEQLYAWEAKFNIAKFRVHGSSRERLNVISLSVVYNTGSIRR